MGDKPPDHFFNGATTEEEFDAVDALLSLSTIRDNTTEELDDNAELMLIRGGTVYKDVHPVSIELDQVAVDGAIAQIVEREDIEQSIEHTEQAKNNETDEVGDNELNKRKEKPAANKDTTNNNEPVAEEEQSPNKGYVKLTSHGIKKKNTEGHSYRYQLCEVKKRSASSLNEHHRRRHKAQMCGVCGKLFKLASSLSHHMYSHNI